MKYILCAHNVQRFVTSYNTVIFCCLYFKSIDVYISEASSNSKFDSNDESTESCQISVASECIELLNTPDDQICLKEKLRNCAIKHVNHITRSFLNDLFYDLKVIQIYQKLRKLCCVRKELKIKFSLCCQRRVLLVLIFT